MSVVAFGVLGFMFAMYVLLDGYDLGVGAIAPFVAPSEQLRATARRSIGPFWNGNEVWLIAAGGTLFAFFPAAYAASISAFYLPFMVALWLLIFRGMAMELREHYHSEIWHGFWDAAFFLASALLAVLLGVAIGNLVRGLPLGHGGYFLGTFTFLLNPYALATGLLALLALSLHGAVFLMMRSVGELLERSTRAARVLWIGVVAAYLAVTFATLLARAHGGLWVAILPLLSLGALAAARIAIARQNGIAAFAGSAAFIASLLLAAAFTMFPYILPGFPHAESGMSIYAASPSPFALATALVVESLGVLAVLAYGAFVIRRLCGKIDA